MRLELLKPLHGWRQFIGEVSIIVLGVLIALAAQQAVDALHWRDEVGQFRTAVDHEIGYNLSAYEYRLKQASCVERRLDQLSAWAAWSKERGPAKLAGPISMPMRLAVRTSAWEWRTGEVANHIPLGDRMAYSEFYDDLAEFKSEEGGDFEVWRDIGVFQTKSILSEADQTKLAALIAQARLVEQVMEANWVPLKQVANRLHVTPEPDPNDAPPKPDFCRPIFPVGHLQPLRTSLAPIPF